MGSNVEYSRRTGKGGAEVTIETEISSPKNDRKAIYKHYPEMFCQAAEVDFCQADERCHLDFQFF